MRADSVLVEEVLFCAGNRKPEIVFKQVPADKGSSTARSDTTHQYCDVLTESRVWKCDNNTSISSLNH